MTRYSLSELCSKIEEDFILRGKLEDAYIEKLSTPNNADKYSLVFISPQRTDKQEMFEKTLASVVICDDSIKIPPLINKSIIIVKDPKYIFSRIGNALFVQKPEYKIHPSSIIHEDAIIEKNVYIGPNVYIGKCTIQKNTVIHGNCYLYDDVFIGENVLLQAGCIIGAPGCGHIRKKDNTYESFPHIGGVIIESYVEIGTNSCIAKGALGNTTIKKGVIIDSFVQVGHNVLIEENALILANSVIGGSSIVKKNATLAIGSHICDYIIIGEGAHIGPGVSVIKDVLPHTKVIPKPSLTLP